MMNPFTKVNEVITIPVPEHLRKDVARACAEWQGPLMFTLAEQLEDMGIGAAIATHIEVNILMTWACRAAYLAAHLLEHRQPDPERWLSACLDEYQRTEKWFADNYNKHNFHPSAMHMGDCTVCGNTADHPIHGGEAVPS